MKKSDLKPGMVVQFRNGKRAGLIGTYDDMMVVLDNNDHKWLSIWSDNLKYLGVGTSLDIVKVYKGDINQWLEGARDIKHRHAPEWLARPLRALYRFYKKYEVAIALLLVFLVVLLLAPLFFKVLVYLIEAYTDYFAMWNI